jgi:SAM-dependent methyltransferase
MAILNKVHEKLVFNRRVNVIASQFIKLIPQNAYVLDVGCGSGLIDKLIMNHRPDIKIVGIDVLLRPETHIKVTPFDGKSIPFKAKTFDAVIFIDVLHHIDQPFNTLKEAKRVSKGLILIKDHAMDGFLAKATLTFMDWVGNAHHGVRLPYNYWSNMQWKSNLKKLNLVIDLWISKLSLYPRPASWLFDRKLHFVAKLKF